MRRARFTKSSGGHPVFSYHDLMNIVITRRGTWVGTCLFIGVGLAKAQERDEEKKTKENKYLGVLKKLWHQVFATY